MTIKTLIEKFKFTWNEDGTMLTLEGISLSDLNEILKGFKIDNFSHHDVFIHAFSNGAFKEYMLKKGLNYSDSALAAQSTMHLLPNLEEYSRPYAEEIANYIFNSSYGQNGLIAVIPEIVGDLYFGRSLRNTTKEKSSYYSFLYDGFVDKIYMTVGNQDNPYCAYDDLLQMQKMETELIFGFISFCVENYDQYFDENSKIADLNAPIFKLEINPKFILIYDFIQQTKKNNVETFKDKIREKDFYKFFDLSEQLSDHLTAVLSGIYGKYFDQRQNYENRKIKNNLEETNKI